MAFKTIPGLLYNGIPVGYDDGVATSPSPTPTPISTFPSDAALFPGKYVFHQHADFVNGSRVISSITIDSPTVWLVDFTCPVGYNHIFRLAIANYGGGDGIKHVDILDDVGRPIASGEATPGSISLYLDAGSHGYGYPNVTPGRKYYMALSVPIQGEYNQAFMDIQQVL
jgi:hypothetical protein